jgi:hypothetical protein
MANAIKQLVDWYYEHPKDFVQSWLDGLKTKDQRVRSVDASRRMVSTYFVDVARLRREKFISKQFARMIAGQQGLNVYYEIIVPMNLAQNRPETTRNTVRELKKLYSKFEDGLYNPRRSSAAEPNSLLREKQA